jgi:hypothetical protein
VTMASLWKKQKTPGRKKVARETLELAIAAAVKSDPQWEAFVGVWVEPCAQKTAEDANWAIKGIKFGKADRDKCRAALDTVVERMQGEFELQPDDAAG